MIPWVHEREPWRGEDSIWIWPIEDAVVQGLFDAVDAAEGSVDLQSRPKALGIYDCRFMSALDWEKNSLWDK
jgi:hypothetical protein